MAATGSAILPHDDFADAVHFDPPEPSPERLPGPTVPEGQDVRLLFLRGEEDGRVPSSISGETRSSLSAVG